MPLAPQEIRTFFISFQTWDRRRLLQSDRFCELLLDVLRDYRHQRKFLIHEFVFMPDHVHLILTPEEKVSREKAVQLVRGGFSYRAKKELRFNGEIWQPGSNEHRIKDPADYAQHVEYIWMNPVKAALVKRPEDYRYSSASLSQEVDPAPPHFLLKASKAAR